MHQLSAFLSFRSVGAAFLIPIFRHELSNDAFAQELDESGKIVGFHPIDPTRYFADYQVSTVVTCKLGSAGLFAARLADNTIILGRHKEFCDQLGRVDLLRSGAPFFNIDAFSMLENEISRNSAIDAASQLMPNKEIANAWRDRERMANTLGLYPAHKTSLRFRKSFTPSLASNLSTEANLRDNFVEKSLPLGYRAYRAFTSLLSPLAPLLLRQRTARNKEDPARITERLGLSQHPRPAGPLIWIHGASVGECIAALPLVDALLKDERRNVLVTSGTVTSAKMMSERLPKRALHQFVPVDLPSTTARFLDHWKPDVGLFVDSDIWPNLVFGAKKRGINLALINARMSEQSFANWNWARGTAAALLSAFSVCLAQDEEIAGRFRMLGAHDVRAIGSLKADAPPLGADLQKLQNLTRASGKRPILLAAQTHPGEDETILPASDVLRRTFPNLLTILVPRHVERGPEIAMLCGARPTKRRALGEMPDADTLVYVADTMGELGLFYRLARFAFVGGSLIRHGGQNPLEPARLDCAVLAGPHTFNFTSAYEAIFRAQGTGLVHSSAEIAEIARRLLEDNDEAQRLSRAAAEAADTLGGAVGKTVAAIEQLLASDART